jgi:hypothetical protein
MKAVAWTFCCAKVAAVRGVKEMLLQADVVRRG